MKITAWILVLAALAVIGGLGGLLLSGADRTAQELLESAQRRQLQGDPDLEGALTDLERALMRALQIEKDDHLVAEILIERGRVQRELELLGPAREDLSAVLDEYRPGDKAVEMELVAIDMLAGQYDDALDRATDVLQRDPAYTPAWTYRGQILMLISDEYMQRCETVLRSAEPAEVAEQDMILVHRITGMDLDDPYRVALLHELRGHFEPEEENLAREALRMVDYASEAIASAREAFAESFAGQLDADAAEMYLRLLLRSGRTQDALDYGLAIVHHAAANSNPATMQLLMEALTEAGRPEAGALLIDHHLGRRVFPDQGFYLSWCNTLRLAKRWKNLLFISDRMRQAGDTEFSAAAEFYYGMARFELGEYLQARIALESFVEEETVVPLPGAFAQAWRMLSISARELGDPFAENTALQEALKLDPEIDGELWLRKSVMLAAMDNPSLVEAEKALAHAMRLMPERVEELLPMWTELGEAALAAAGVHVDLLRRDLRAQNLFTPLSETGPYELYKLGKLHEENGEPTGVVYTCDKILLKFPGFLPAIDLCIRATQQLGNEEQVAKLALERMERFGADRKSIARVSRLPASVLNSEQTLRFMQLDPGLTGRLIVAEALAREGRYAQALNGLTTLGLEPLGGDGFLLAGELMLRLGHYADALETLGTINKGNPRFAQALAMRLEAAFEIGHRSWMQKLSTDPSKPEHLDREALLPVIDRMLCSGHFKQSKAFLERLDEYAETRSGGVVLRLAMVQLLLDERDEAEETLDRAEALTDSGMAAFGRALIATEQEEWGTLPLQMADVVRSTLRTTAVQHAAISLMDERLGEAADIAVRKIEEEGDDDPLWSLFAHAADVLRAEPIRPDPQFGVENSEETMLALHGLGSGKRDPRRLLVRIAAVETPPWTVWAVAEMLRDGIEAEGTMWPAYLAARGYRHLGLREDATELLVRINERWPTFAPAWDLREELELERLGRIDHLDLVQLRHQRRRELGLRAGEEAEERLTLAWAAEQTGNLDRAVKMAREAVELDGEFLPARFKLAQLLRERGKYKPSIEAYQEAFSSAPEENTFELAEEFLGVLQEAHEADPEQFPETLVQAELERLAQRLPRDPLVALHLARGDLRTPGLSPALAIDRAYRRLANFRAATEKVPIDSLRPGCSALWKDFFAAVDPERAEEFVRTELRARPGSLDLWTMLAETYETQGRLREAIELYETVQQMVPDARGRLRIAWLQAVLGEPHERVADNLAAAEELDPLVARGARVQLITARSMFNLDGANQKTALDKLAALWRSREENAVLDKAQLGQVYGTLLVHRADPEDRETSYEVLRETVPLVDDSARRNLLMALANLGKQIPMRRRVPTRASESSPGGEEDFDAQGSDGGR